jgi:beta-mannosidase
MYVLGNASPLIANSAHNRIPDTSRDLNELDSQWVDDKEWSYRCQFETPSVAQTGDRVDLVFEGLDTYATVRLNDQVILQSDNMFTPYRVNVNPNLSPSGTNTLSIDFGAAGARSKAVQDAHPEHQFSSFIGGGERLAARKAQYHWGWDWGPIFLTAGPWRPVRLETYQSRIEDLSVQYELDKGLHNCQGTISARISGHLGDQIRLAIRDSNGIVVFETVCQVSPEGLAQAHFAIRGPSLWYPHGYGDQYRYHLDGELISGNNVQHTVTKRISFRKAELIQEADEFGKSFYFYINEVDIFAGGSCWIPADNFVPRITPEKYVDWLKLMVEGNQIMIR